ncbi:MAG: tRNA dihydrouridine synthase [Desulfonatronovibrio sp.]|nr:tRNA-dihydrouridine synthase family protein [Desulfovibrionales bacterium]
MTTYPKKNQTAHPSLLPINPYKPWLAPLAGFSDLPFRLLCREYGCAAAFTEMISAKGLVYQTRNTLELLKTSPEDHPLVVQIYGSEPQTIYQAMQILLDLGYEYFDLNCGCSVKKVIKTGSGAALLNNISLLEEMANIMIQAAGSGNSGIKIRLGWNMDNQVYTDLAGRLENSGIGWITLHPRTATQLFGGTARWSALKILKDSCSIPVVASGDLFSAEDGLNCVSQTGVDNIMFARGALNDPSIFTKYIRLLQKDFSFASDMKHLKEMCFKTITYYQEYYPAPKAILKMRTVLPRMIRQSSGAKELRKAIVMSKDWRTIENIISQIA